MHRDKITAEEVNKRIQKQIDVEIAKKLCDFTINNNEQELLIPQVLQIHNTLLKKAK
jgi:dephospho-CoA kinase